MIIYKVTNTVTGGIYIGATTLSLERRKSNHFSKAKTTCPTVFHEALLIYGEENFKWERIYTCSFTEELEIMERYYIYILGALEYPNYNRHPGGRTAECLPKDGKHSIGNKHSLEAKEKMSKAKKGKKFTKTHKENLKKSRQGRITKDSTRQKLREAFTGKINIKYYKITSPEGEVYITTRGLTQFCKEHGLLIGGFMKVLNGRTKKDNYKGWYIEEQQKGDNNGNN